MIDSGAHSGSCETSSVCSARGSLSRFMTISLVISWLMHAGAVGIAAADVQRSFSACVFTAVRFKYQVQDCCVRRCVFVMVQNAAKLAPWGFTTVF